jgi:hypothetical protein
MNVLLTDVRKTAAVAPRKFSVAFAIWGVYSIAFAIGDGEIGGRARPSTALAAG